MTLNGGLSPLEAQIELALPGDLRNAMIQIDLAGLPAAGYEIPTITTVTSKFGLAGGGSEMLFPYEIPPQFIKVIWP